jgi:hypothetical protein
VTKISNEENTLAIFTNHEIKNISFLEKFPVIHYVNNLLHIFGIPPTMLNKKSLSERDVHFLYFENITQIPKGGYFMKIAEGVENTKQKNNAELKFELFKIGDKKILKLFEDGTIMLQNNKTCKYVPIEKLNHKYDLKNELVYSMMYYEPKGAIENVNEVSTRLTTKNISLISIFFMLLHILFFTTYFKWYPYFQ